VPCMAGEAGWFCYLKIALVSHAEDSDSVRAILGERFGDGGIIKTVSISVHEHRGDQEELQSSSEESCNRIARFESV
jgi:hypothetical protein